MASHIFSPSRRRAPSVVGARRLAPGIALLALAASSCTSAAGDDTFVPFDQAIEAFLADNGLDGATAVVVHRDLGILHQRGYGSFRADRISLLASSSKILSAGILLHLADQGLLDLDAPVSDYLSASWGSYKTDITVAQLLSNSAGMVGLVDDATYAPYLCQYIPGFTLAACAEAIYAADDLADRVPPDTEFHYGGGQWQLAGGIAEQVSGKDWAELVEEIYVQPCGLGTLGYTNQYAAAFVGAGGVDGAFAYPSFFDGNVADLPSTQNPNIEGGAFTTARDYGEILLMHLRGGVCVEGRVLEAASVVRMQEDRIGAVYDGDTFDTRFPGYGFGWWVSRDEPGIVADMGAYGATPWLDVERGYGVMIIIEGRASMAADLYSAIQPVVEAIIDGLAAEADAG